MHTCNHSPWEAEAGMFQALLDYTVKPQKKSEYSGIRMANRNFPEWGVFTVRNENTLCLRKATVQVAVHMYAYMHTAHIHTYLHAYSTCIILL